MITIQDLVCFDQKGNYISHFYQWDSGLKIYFDDMFPVNPIVHFCNRNSKKALSVKTVLSEDGRIEADVPNILLLEPYAISVYIFLIHDDTKRTVLYKKIPVRARKQPDDYFYTENVEVVYLSELQEQIIALNQAITAAESERVDNESVRVQAENERTSNEEVRQNTLNEMNNAIEQATTVISNCQTATDEANTAANKANESVNGIKNAAFCDVANDLTTIEEGKVLDARQGNILFNCINEEITQADIDALFSS